jgi:hypothetical protein
LRGTKQSNNTKIASPNRGSQGDVTRQIEMTQIKFPVFLGPPKNRQKIKKCIKILNKCKGIGGQKFTKELIYKYLDAILRDLSLFSGRDHFF